MALDPAVRCTDTAQRRPITATASPKRDDVPREEKHRTHGQALDSHCGASGRPRGRKREDVSSASGRSHRGSNGRSSWKSRLQGGQRTFSIPDTTWTWDWHDGLPIKPDPQLTTPGRFEGSPDWQSHGVSGNGFGGFRVCVCHNVGSSRLVPRTSSAADAQGQWH